MLQAKCTVPWAQRTRPTMTEWAPALYPAGIDDKTLIGDRQALVGSQEEN